MAASLIAGTGYHSLVLDWKGDMTRFAGAGLAAAALFLPIMHIQGLYRPDALLTFHRQATMVTASWIGTFGFLTALVFALKIGEIFSRGSVLVFFALGLVLLVGHRAFWRLYIGAALRRGQFAKRKVVVIGDQEMLADPRFSGDLGRVGFVAAHNLVLRQSEDMDAQIVEIVARAVAIARGRAGIQEMVVALDWSRLPLARRLLEELRAVPLPVRLILSPAAAEIIAQPWQRFGSLVAIDVQRAPFSPAERTAKRAIDIAVAGTALVLLSPLMALTALLIKYESPGPVLFRQTRHGFNNRTFTILKFRSMTVTEDGGTVIQAQRGDSRVTRIGRVIRSTSIDELPQLWNVLRGEMSIVGPRPHAVAHGNYYQDLISHYAFRHHVKPGLTGWAQIHGCRGETPTVESMVERVDYDIWYVNNWSLWLDLRILLRTAGTVLNIRNTY